MTTKVTGLSSERLTLDDCWLYAGLSGNTGHGKINQWYEGKSLSLAAHKVMYENLISEVPEGMELDHLCENPPCVNPAHLEPVTHQENIKRHYRNKTHCRNGHEYTEENTMYADYNPKGTTRRCRECRRRSANKTKLGQFAHKGIADGGDTK